MAAKTYTSQLEDAETISVDRRFLAGESSRLVLLHEPRMSSGMLD